ncbi:class I SAM-dependent methyltransferase [Microlunatus capsulatus]|uniref:Ubiquinone/menaquinone biosynthesis C-methylase UbiE n=1 Tax=Microlunatus capsulatus TaxID=99117 RepID=A0ABS4Z9G2_9ACTN|nr:class I SAM-dependent methyltransferase [Microlunatus capsulatus]MBP2417693.1 ubiquinone/menaquinone biosynthesis C-methylase UbiE [Microlunatus capsulatus]
MISTQEVPLAFDEAAPSYDAMVALNPGYHAHLATAAEALLEAAPAGRPLALVDLGCGSGASTRALVTAARDADRDVALTGVDASSGMLDEAHAKRWPTGVSFEHGLAQDLAARRSEFGLAGPVDGVLAAYLFRNVGPDERDAVLRDVHDLLAPDGVLVVQEYSVAQSRVADLVWSLVCWLVVIPLSWVTSRQTRLYRYLWRSVRAFDAVQTFVDRLYAAGFVDVEVSTAPGWQRGILHTFRARRAG